MPMIALTTTENITPEISEQLAAGLGRAISLIPGKSESRLMLSFTGGTPMYFGGQVRRIAFVAVNCFGHAPAEAYNDLTGAICSLLEEALAISPEDVFIKYSETENWGWNGHNF